MTLKTKVYRRGMAVALSISLVITAFSPLAQSQDFSMNSATPTPTGKEENPFIKLASQRRKPIPLIWKVAIVLAALAAAAVALRISMRVWQSANLFDREYRFPTPAAAPLRLGGSRSGGHMATIGFDDRDRPLTGENS